MKNLLILISLAMAPAVLLHANQAEDAEYAKLNKRYQTMEKEYRALLDLVNTNLVRTDVLPNLCNARLTVTSLTPVVHSGSGATLYLTPFRGNQISVYTGSVWQTMQFTELSTTDGSLTASKMYDVFVYNNSGTLALEFSTAWTNTTTRADALSLQDGVYVKNSNKTRRLVGTIYYVASFYDSTSGRRIWNYCNRLPRPLTTLFSIDTWSYAGTTWQETNGTTATFNFVVGVADTLLYGTSNSIAGTAASQTDVSLGWGIDSATTNSAILMGGGANPSMPQALSAEYYGYPSVGYHSGYSIEVTSGTSTTFYGDNGVSGAASDKRVQAAQTYFIEG